MSQSYLKECGIYAYSIIKIIVNLYFDATMHMPSIHTETVHKIHMTQLIYYFEQTIV